MPGYRPGDFWRICDRCGFQKRASETFKTWDGLYVCEADFETRHPQDFVRGRRDNQNVPDPRPETPDTIIGPLQTQIAANAAAGATSLTVDSSVRFLASDRIGIILDTGSMERRVVDTVPTSTSITITQGISGSASIGNILINYSAVSQADIG